jgi:SP family general alpha glucoside:H+ symporter-like MFS transporter
MSDPVDSTSYGGTPEVEAKGGFQVEHAYNLDEKAHVADYKADAVEAENAEHNMSVLEAVRAYPMASFWAFVMSFTIVSAFPLFHLTFPTRNRS